MCFFWCHGVHRQTNRHSRKISEMVPARTLVCAHAEITRTRLSCGGDECDADSLSLFIHTYIPDTRVCMFVCLRFWVHLTAGCRTLIRSRSLYIHTCQHAYLCVSVCIYLFFFLFVFLSIPNSWLPNSLFLLDTGALI